MILALDPAKVSIMEAVIYAYLLTLFVTGVFAFPGFVFPTNRILPASYYIVTNPKTVSKLYRVLGVKYFRAMLMLLFWGQKKNKAKFFDGTRNGIDNLIFQSKQSEIGHLLPLVLISVVSISFLVHQHFLLAAITMGINIIGNFYPIVLQRHHRMRIQKIEPRP